MVAACGLDTDSRPPGWSLAVTAVPCLFFPQRVRQAQREDALELTEKLDQDWKEIQTLLAHRTHTAESRDTPERPKVRGGRLKREPHSRPRAALALREGGRRAALPACRLCASSSQSPFLLGLKFSAELVCVTSGWKQTQSYFDIYSRIIKENGCFLVREVLQGEAFRWCLGFPVVSAKMLCVGLFSL